MTDYENVIDLIERYIGVPAPEEVEQFHAEMNPTYLSQYHKLVKNSSKALEEIPVHNQFFNDHGPRHVCRIIQNIEILTSDLDYEFTQLERYILASAAWLHDIGMSINKKIDADDVLSETYQHNPPEWFSDIVTTSDDTEKIEDSDLIRKWHHVLSSKFVLQNASLFGIPNPAVAKIIADVCKVHREGISMDHLHEKDNIRFTEEHRGTVRTRSIAALFQFADALDVTMERAPKISTETQELPPESRPHWRINQIINDIEYDVENRLVGILSKHENEEDKEFLRQMVSEIYSEYEDVKDHLASEPYPLYMVDVYCETSHKEALESVETRLSGQDEYLTRVKKVGRERKKKQSQELEELDNEWVFNIQNNSGDALIRRNTTIKILSEDLEKRTHFARCFDSTCDEDWNSKIIAQDAHGNELDVEVEIDRPKHKRFSIYFPESIGVDDVFEYKYEFEWEGFFPKEKEEFEMKGSSESVNFEVQLPESMNITDVYLHELLEQRNTIVNRKNINTATGNIDEKYEKNQKSNDVCLHWTQV